MKQGRFGCCGVARSVAVEDCLRTIFVRSGHGDAATTSFLADRLAVAPPTVSALLKRLDDGGLVVRSTDHRILLTPHGEGHAKDVVRRHRLVEAFLATTVGMPWDEVDAEADLLEHAISDRLLDRIDEFLGHPALDPHGDPIPRPGGHHVEAWSTALSRAAVPSRFRVDRVSDRDSAALRHLGGLGIRPGAVLDVLERAPFDGPLWIQVDDARHGLGPALSDVVHGRTA